VKKTKQIRRVDRMTGLVMPGNKRQLEELRNEQADKFKRLIKADIYQHIKKYNGIVTGSFIIKKLGEQYNVLNKEIGKLLNELIDESKIKIQRIGNQMVLVLCE
jgi:hypothetical protein